MEKANGASSSEGLWINGNMDLQADNGARVAALAIGTYDKIDLEIINKNNCCSFNLFYGSTQLINDLYI
ncbi:hypothetical protein GQ457_06G011940 [Hibiscus cannabinus]